MLRAGANCKNIITIDESEEGLTLSDRRLEIVFHEYKPTLLIIDPLQAYLGAKVDMHRANEIRPVLSKIGRLSEEYNCTTILIMHLSKGSQSNSIYRGLGSIDIPAVARSVLLVGKNPNNPSERAIAHIKSSLAPTGDTIGFEIHQELGFRWTGKSDLTADDMLAVKTAGKYCKADEAEEFLKNLLNDTGEMLYKTIIKMAQNAGISEKTLRRAQEKLGIKAEKRGYGKNSCWVWVYDNCANKDKDGQNSKGTQLAIFDKSNIWKVATASNAVQNESNYLRGEI